MKIKAKVTVFNSLRMPVSEFNLEGEDPEGEQHFRDMIEHWWMIEVLRQKAVPGAVAIYTEVVE